MSADPDELDDATLERIFTDYIVPTLFAGKSASDAPVGAIVGAQPGAGKTRVVAAVGHELAPSAVIVGDDLRKFHPGHDAAMARDPLGMPALTAHAAGTWVDRAVQEACDRGISLVIETTFRRPETVLRTAQRLRDAGHQVHVYALAVPSAVSRLGTVQRYVAQLEEHGAGRWTHSQFHDDAVTMMPETLERVVDAGLVDELHVVDRSGRDLYIAQPGTDGAAARRALDVGRTLQTMTPQAATSWVQEYARCSRVLLEASEKNPDVVATLAELGRQGEPIAQAAGTDVAAAQLSDAVATVRRAQLQVARPRPLAAGPAASSLRIHLGERPRNVGPSRGGPSIER